MKFGVVTSFSMIHPVKGIADSSLVSHDGYRWAADDAHVQARHPPYDL
jgi:hypothetical protein